MYTCSDWIADRLVSLGVDHVFMLPGNQVDELVKAIANHPYCRPILAGQELTAGYMADGYARSKMRFGVCLSIGSCGLTGLVSAVACANQDDTPILFITGDVPTRIQHNLPFQGMHRGYRTDNESTLPFVAYHAICDSKETLQMHFENAVEILLTRSRPVHLCIPCDVQKLPFDPPPLAIIKKGSNEFPTSRMHERLAPSASSSSLVGIERYRCPVVVVGPRYRGKGARESLIQLSEKYSIPIATTLAAKGLFPENHPNSLGHFGFAGSCLAFDTILGESADMILYLGADFNERDTLCWRSELKTATKRLVHVDTHPNECQAIRPDEECVVSSPSHWLDEELCRMDQSEARLLPEVRYRQASSQAPWWKLGESKRTCTVTIPTKSSESTGLNWEMVVRACHRTTPADSAVVVDSGQTRVFVGHYWQANEFPHFYSACRTAPIGWALPASVGIALANPDKVVIAWVGDGCMSVTGLEFATLAKYQLPVVVILCNNGSHGSVLRRGVPESVCKLPAIDWSMFAISMGGLSYKVHDESTTEAQLEEIFRDAIRQATTHCKPILIDLAVPAFASLSKPGLTPSAADIDANEK